MRRLIVLALMFAGCATLKSTPAQERTEAHVQECKNAVGSSDLQIIVGRDGGFRMTGAESTIWPFKRCLTERFGYRWQ